MAFEGPNDGDIFLKVPQQQSDRQINENNWKVSSLARVKLYKIGWRRQHYKYSSSTLALEETHANLTGIGRLSRAHLVSVFP